MTGSTKWGKSHDKIRKSLFPEPDTQTFPNLPTEILEPFLLFHFGYISILIHIIQK